MRRISGSLLKAGSLARNQLGLVTVLGESSSFQAATYAINAPQDYALALKGAHELTQAASTPIPKNEAGYLCGIPAETLKRHVRIYSPTRTPEQAGFAKALHNSNHSPSWKLDFEPTTKWEDPLMGWTSTADPLENLARATLNFFTKEEAISFCTKLGWGYTVDEPLARRTDRPKKVATYSDNYSVKRKGYPDLSHLPSNRGAK